MAQTPEGKVKAAIKKLLNRHLAYYHMPVPTGHGKMNGLDFLGCHYGIFFAIEAKAPGEVPTVRQNITIDEIESAGGRVFVIDNDDCEEIEELAEWLVSPTLGM